jgi:hypothetical protein
MALSRLEQETIINFNEAEDEAHVYTHNERWQKYLESIGFKPYRTNSFGGNDYKIPKYMIRLPRQKVQLSAQEKARRSDAARRMVANRHG